MRRATPHAAASVLLCLGLALTAGPTYAGQHRHPHRAAGSCFPHADPAAHSSGPTPSGGGTRSEPLYRRTEWAPAEPAQDPGGMSCRPG